MLFVQVQIPLILFLILMLIMVMVLDAAVVAATLKNGGINYGNNS